MRGNRSRPRTGERIDWRAADRVDELLRDRGWTVPDLERNSARSGHPNRVVSKRSVYRVLSNGHIPTAPVQFEIAAVFGLLPSHIWGDRPIPSDPQSSAREAVAC